MSKKDIWIALLLTLISGVIFHPFASVGIDPHHDGIMLKPALDVASGQVLFRDTFSQYGPLTTYLQALALLVSPTLLCLRILTLIAYAASLGFLYLAWRSVLPRVLAVMACLLYMVYVPFYHPNWPMLPWSSALALLFQSIAILSLMRIVAGERPAVWAWVLGVTCACTLWCRQPVGIILAGSLGVIAFALHFTGWRTTASSSVRIWTRVALGFGVVSALIIGNLAINEALGAWWEQNILWPKRWAAAVDQSMFFAFSRQSLDPMRGLGLFALLAIGFLPAILRRVVFPRLPQWMDLVWPGVLVFGYYGIGRSFARTWLLMPDGGWNVVIVMLVFAQVLFSIAPGNWFRERPRSADYYWLAALAGIALGSIAQFYPVPCSDHIYWAIAPALGVFVYLCWTWTRTTEWACAVVVLVFLLPAGYDKYRWGKHTLDLPYTTLTSPRVFAGMRAEPEQGAALQRVDAVIQGILRENPERTAILYGVDAFYLAWFNNKVNPSPYYVTWSGLLLPVDRKLRLGFIEYEAPVLLLNSRGGEEDSTQKLLDAVNYRIVHNEPTIGLRLALPAGAATQAFPDSSR